jgi:hypothetical protein
VRLQLTRSRLVLMSAFAAVASQTTAAAQAVAPATPDALAPAPVSAPSSIDVRATTEFGSYADTDHVFVQTPSLSGTLSNPTAGWSVDARYLVDVVSAASVDIVSTASRRWEEVRQEGSVSAAFKPGAFGASASGIVSSEPDYVSWTAGGAFTQDVLAKNVTWLLAYYHAHDIAGRTGTPFSVFSHAINREAFKAGVTLVLGPSTIAALVGDVVVESGDPSKPYRYIPLFAPGTVVPLGASIDQVNQLRTSARPLEQLPLSRSRFALTGRLAHRFRRATLRLEERLYADSWLLVASTTDARLLLDVGSRVEVGPHLRLHAQTAVDFWQRAYVLEPGFNYPALRTGDRELGPLVNVTTGFTLRIAVGPDRAPDAWTLGFDVNTIGTQFLDDLYVTDRLAAVGSMFLEARR